MSLNSDQRRKAALIPILALVLAYLLWSRYAGDGVPGGEPATTLASAAAHIMRSRQQTATALADLDTSSSFNLDAALEHDPFAPLPQLTPDQAAEDIADVDVDETVNEPADDDPQEPARPPALLRNLEVTAVLTSGSQPSALLGTQVIRVGDTLPGGATVVSIDRHGVVVRLP